jgi:hypothetical protein
MRRRGRYADHVSDADAHALALAHTDADGHVIARGHALPHSVAHFDAEREC